MNVLGLAASSIVDFTVPDPNFAMITFDSPVTFRTFDGMRAVLTVADFNLLEGRSIGCLTLLESFIPPKILGGYSVNSSPSKCISVGGSQTGLGWGIVTYLGKLNLDYNPNLAGNLAQPQP